MRPLALDFPTSDRPRFAPWMVFLGAFLIPLIYLPTLGTRFDFIDDGNLVYPAPPMPMGDRLGLVWQKIAANYEHLGPFRPVLWAHWELFAELCDGEALPWRLVRLGWCMLATATLLALMREIRLRAWPSLLAASLAMWNPYRNEIWTSLTLSEGVAMPYALAGLWCAARANRSARPWPWDLASALGVLAALGCKNTFAAIVPAQLFLRMYADGAAWREGLQRYGRRAAWLALTLFVPIGHYIFFRLHWHPGQYPPTGATAAQFGRMVSALAGAISLDFMGIGLAATIVVLMLVRHSASNRTFNSVILSEGKDLGGTPKVVRFAQDDRIVLTAAGLLTVTGIAVYLPMPAVSGRYTMPAVWGLDLAFAGLLGALFAVRTVTWRRLAMAGIIGGLLVVAAANVGRQVKFTARIDLLWQTLECVEREADPDARLAWISSAALNTEEGIHFRWHLIGRGHQQLEVELFSESGRADLRCELPGSQGGMTLAVTGSSHAPPGGPWSLRQEFHVPYWSGRRHFDCYLWNTSSLVSGASAKRR